MDIGGGSFECTKRGKIISINRLINCFDDNDVEKAKSLLFEKLLEKKKECECDFVQLLYLTMSQHLSLQNVNQLYKQIENIFDEKSDTRNIKTKDYNQKLLHYDRKTIALFYQLPTDTIDVLSRFLNERDSIIFGCTNRLLYYYTQCTSFMKNCNNQIGLYRDEFEMHMKRIEKKLDANRIKTQILCKNIGSFEAMEAFSRNYSNNNNIVSDIHFDNDYKYNEKMFNKLPENINKLINGKIDDLKEDDIHGILVHKIRELESTYPYRIASKISVLESLPLAIKEELQNLPRIRLFEMMKNGKKYKLIDDAKDKPESEICENLLQHIQSIYQSVKNWDARILSDIQYRRMNISLNNTVNGINTPRNRYFVAVQRALVSVTKKFVLCYIKNEKLRKQLHWANGQLQAKEEVERMNGENKDKEKENKEKDDKIADGDKDKLFGQLQRRYQEMYGLYHMKSGEVENLNNALFQAQQQSEEYLEYIGELETRVGNLMSSAAQNVESRMQYIQGGGLVQTFSEMMTLLRGRAENGAAAANDLYNCVDEDLVHLLPDQMSNERAKLLDQYIRNIKHPCQFILNQFNLILEQFVGVRQFVHPDHEMVEALQQHIKQLKQQIDSNNETPNLNQNDNENEDQTVIDTQSETNQVPILESILKQP